MDHSEAAKISENKELKKYSGVAGRILNLMKAGVTKQEMLAKAVGCSPAYVAQLLSEEDFQVQVAADVKAGIERSLEIDETYDKIERKLVEKLATMSDMFITPEQVMRALRLVNEANRKTQTARPMQTDDTPGRTGNVVKLILPVVIKNQFVVNPNNEVVQVDDRDMVTLNSQSISTLVKNYETQKQLPKELEDTKLNIQTPQGSNHEHERSPARKVDKWSDL
jgi:hypothetical protein